MGFLGNSHLYGKTIVSNDKLLLNICALIDEALCLWY